MPGTRGCTLEAAAYRDRCGDITSRGAKVIGVSTQTPGGRIRHVQYPIEDPAGSVDGILAAFTEAVREPALHAAATGMAHPALIMTAETSGKREQS